MFPVILIPFAIILVDCAPPQSNPNPDFYVQLRRMKRAIVVPELDFPVYDEMEHLKERLKDEESDLEETKILLAEAKRKGDHEQIEYHEGNLATQKGLVEGINRRFDKCLKEYNELVEKARRAGNLADDTEESTLLSDREVG